MSKMNVDIKVGETLQIGSATVKLVKKSGQMARLEVTAASDTAITVPKTTARMSALPATNGAHNHGERAI